MENSTLSTDGSIGTWSSCSPGVQRPLRPILTVVPFQVCDVAAQHDGLLVDDGVQTQVVHPFDKPVERGVSERETVSSQQHTRLRAHDSGGTFRAI
jgi:hypothetical protein